MSTFSSYDISLHTKAGGCGGRWAYPCVLMRETMKDESVLECISLPYYTALKLPNQIDEGLRVVQSAVEESTYL